MENVKLKTTNDELSRALETTSQELTLAQEQLTMLQEQAARLHQEKEMWAYAPIVHIYDLESAVSLLQLIPNYIQNMCYPF